MLKNDKGFTLIEMAIVLVIIGLILGAVIKGKDVLNSAKQKKFYTTFVKEWELSIASYFDRTGNLLGDGTANGGSVATKNGQFDNVAGTDFTNINNALKAVGLTEIVSNVTSNGQYTYTGTYSGSATMTMHLYYLYSHRELRYRNALYFTGMPTDLAIAIDTMVDGEADAEKGNFRQYTDANGSAWPNASTTTTVNAAYTINLP
ncbi:prepilin-type N-terminal cleavage/methylation domain-containing protein [Desulforhopalus sp. IMCC35007]|nr:prepilin-type N-terminal cleavage/methylation domain-containing protein [Desulforhopalus sp. IMCC35007]